LTAAASESVKDLRTGVPIAVACSDRDNADLGPNRVRVEPVEFDLHAGLERRSRLTGPLLLPDLPGMVRDGQQEATDGPAANLADGLPLGDGRVPGEHDLCVVKFED